MPRIPATALVLLATALIVLALPCWYFVLQHATVASFGDFWLVMAYPAVHMIPAFALMRCAERHA